MGLTWDDEPSLEQVMHQFPGWTGQREIAGHYTAVRAIGGTRVRGEDPVDLRDQIRRAEALTGPAAREAREGAS